MVRLWSFFALIVLWYVLITTRLFYWQVIAGGNLRREATSQYFLELQLPAQRGQILATDGSALVLNQPAFLVYAEPRVIQDKRTFARAIAGPLGLDEQGIVTLIENPGRAWVALAHKVENNIIDELKILKLKGLGFEKEVKRYYPEASMAAQLVGFVGSDQNGNDTGYFGLEGFYDRHLRGKDGSLRLEKDVSGAPILLGQTKRIEPEHGSTLVSSIDRTIQYTVETRLKEGLEKYGAKEGSVVILEPKTGAVLAMASLPSYDPNNFSVFDKTLYKSPIIASSYEPGSTFKTLIMSAGLEENVITPTTEMDESGPVQVGEYAIRTWNNEYHGKSTMTDVLVHSSNVGMVFISRKLGRDKMLSYIHKFGIGEPTSIDLQEETSPELRPEKEWRDIDLATASFGQGIAITPLQMVRAVAAIANGGWLMEPHVIREIRDSHDKTFTIQPKRVRQVISMRAAKTMTEMMIAAVDKGEAQWAKPPGYRIAGKTGTAQIPVAGHYDDKKTIASFVGFAPADDPKFVMLVTLREPSSSPWGSETAAPLFFAIARDIFTYWNIPPQ